MHCTGYEPTTYESGHSTNFARRPQPSGFHEEALAAQAITGAASHAWIPAAPFYLRYTCTRAPRRSGIAPDLARRPAVENEVRPLCAPAGHAPAGLDGTGPEHRCARRRHGRTAAPLPFH